MIEVFLPSGARFEVMTQEEADFVDAASAAYQSNYTFVNPSDISDLDAVVRGEVLCWRWDTWLSREMDWAGEPIDIRHYVDAAKKVSTEVRMLKDQIGIDRKTRERTTGDGSMPEFITRVLTAAKYMGIHRCEQVDLVIELAMQLRSLATVYKNSDDEERRLTRCSAEDIMEWIIEVFDPEMQQHDEWFQHNVQRLWVGEL